MKKIIMLFMAFLMIFSLTACKDTPEPDSSKIKGERYEAGMLSTIVPQGWKAFGIADATAEEAGALVANAVKIAKGAKDEFDLLTKPSVEIRYYGAEYSMMPPEKSFYDDVKDITGLKIGEKIWNGFSAKSFDAPLIVLWSEKEGSVELQITIWTEVGNASIQFEDADVQAIIANIEISK